MESGSSGRRPRLSVFGSFSSPPPLSLYVSLFRCFRRVSPMLARLMFQNCPPGITIGRRRPSHRDSDPLVGSTLPSRLHDWRGWADASLGRRQQLAPQAIEFRGLWHEKGMGCSNQRGSPLLSPYLLLRGSPVRQPKASRKIPVFYGIASRGSAVHHQLSRISGTAGAIWARGLGQGLYGVPDRNPAAIMALLPLLHPVPSKDVDGHACEDPQRHTTLSLFPSLPSSVFCSLFRRLFSSQVTVRQHDDEARSRMKRGTCELPLRLVALPPSPTQGDGYGFSSRTFFSLWLLHRWHSTLVTGFPHTHIAGYPSSRCWWIPGGVLIGLGLQPHPHLPRIDMMVPCCYKPVLFPCVPTALYSLLSSSSLSSFTPAVSADTRWFFFFVGFFLFTSSLLYNSTFTYNCPGGSLISLHL